MPKILSYNPPVNEVRDVEIPLQDGSPAFTLRVRKLDNKILVESVADANGRVTTANDMVRATKLTVEEIKDLIELAFKR